MASMGEKVILPKTGQIILILKGNIILVKYFISLFY